MESYERSIVWIGLCLAEALHHAHLRNLVHCDVKPANILLAADGMPLLLDFHLAQPPVVSGGAAPQWIGGTPPFIAPEQALALAALSEGRPAPSVDARADIYALAMVLHIALVDVLPSDESNIAALLRRANPRISPGLAAIIARGLEKDPQKRYASASLLADDLRRHLDDQPLVGVANRSLTERWTKWRRHNPIALARAGAVVTALVGLATAAFIAWFAADRRIADVIGELEQGRIEVVAGDHRQAAQRLDHALTLLESCTPLEHLLPRAREARASLIVMREKNRRAEMIIQLHDLAERARFLYAAVPATSATARGLRDRLAEIWRVRDQIDLRLAQDADDRTSVRVRADLLDLSILWAELRVELADEAARPERIAKRSVRWPRPTPTGDRLRCCRSNGGFTPRPSAYLWMSCRGWTPSARARHGSIMHWDAPCFVMETFNRPPSCSTAPSPCSLTAFGRSFIAASAPFSAIAS